MEFPYSCLISTGQEVICMVCIYGAIALHEFLVPHLHSYFIQGTGFIVQESWTVVHSLCKSSGIYGLGGRG